MKKIFIILSLLILSCDNSTDLSCDCDVELSGYYMDYNIKPYTGVVVEWSGVEETDINDCELDGTVISNKHGRIETLRCK
jgi:hypothetical protein